MDVNQVKPVRGIDHLGITVPDLEAATRFFVEAFDAVPLYDNLTRHDPPQAGTRAEARLGLEAGGEVIAIRMLQLAHGPGIELFEMTASHQHPAPRPSDFGLQHLALYVDDLHAAAARFEAAGGALLDGPTTMLKYEEGEGNAFRYGRTPWGMTVEFVTYPSPQAYERSTSLRRWKPAAD